MTYDARSVANFLLDHAEEKNVSLTLLALMKIIYHAHGWYLAKSGSPLVRQSLEAWQDGPVVRILWDELSGNGANFLSSRAKRLDVLTNQKTIVEYGEIPPEIADFLHDIFAIYSKIHAFELSKMTHVKGSPWDMIWNDSSGNIKLGMKIPNEVIRTWFSSRDIEILH